MQSTKTLNRLIKKRGITKDRAKQIKQERRTLKNRGYAANCRVKRENEEKQLEEKNKQLRRDIYWGQLRLEESKNELKELTNKLSRLTDQLVQLKREEEEFEVKDSKESPMQLTNIKKENVSSEASDEPPFSIRRPF